MSTGQKKPDWRKGVVVSRSGEPDKPARETEALRLLGLAGAEPDPEKQKQLRLSAQVCQVLGRANEAMVDLKTYKPGPTRGPRWKFDAPLHTFMVETNTTTGETRKWSLARLAVVHFDIPEDQRENTMRRLVRWWTSRD